jgi:hypothetical protein
VGDAKVGHFQCNLLKPLAVALLFRRAAENWPSISGNVNYVNRQASISPAGVTKRDAGHAVHACSAKLLI